MTDVIKFSDIHKPEAVKVDFNLEELQDTLRTLEKLHINAAKAHEIVARYGSRIMMELSQSSRDHYAEQVSMIKRELLNRGATPGN